MPSSGASSSLSVAPPRESQSLLAGGAAAAGDGLSSPSAQFGGGGGYGSQSPSEYSPPAERLAHAINIDGLGKSLASSSSSASVAEADDDIVCRVKPYKWTPPAGYENHIYRQHQGEGSQYLRDFILGVNDGIISTFLVLVGLVAGGATVKTALLTAISTAVAGAISMGLGEYIATKSQTSVNDGEFRLEEEHFKYHRDVELQQLRGFLEGVGLEGNLLEAVVAQVGRNDGSLMKMMQAFEFGAGADDLERSPLMAMWTSGRLFLMGALPTVLPFFFVSTPYEGLWIASILVGAALFFVGAYKTRTTQGNMWKEGFENFIFGVVGAGIAFGVGIAFNRASGTSETF